MSPIVSFQNVSIVFGRNPEQALPLADAGKSRAEIRDETGVTLGVADASLDINEGEIAVLMGLSGSGKSTLLRAVNGLAPITRGKVLIDTGKGIVDPKDCGAKRLRDLRRHEVAMVFQQFALLPWRTVADNVGLGLEFSGIPRRQRRERVVEQLELVGLGDWVDSRVGELSGGMQQRVGLARAFATNAPILLMDEPFSALDPLIRSRLQDELLEIQQRLKKTIIFVSHDLDEAFKIGNRIAIMEGGRIVQVGTAQDIVLRPADDYVADFVAHMNPLNVLTAADVMKPYDRTDEASPANVAQMAEPETPLKKVMAAVSGGKGTVVVARKGEILGQISPQEIVDALERHQVNQ
ncbi:choline ABC transporter ATP-binding protein [Aurantimonas sp. A2-1-M11]|uniref:choline ABC transporter ATP-binding protein n=1 Tax=Aurantimonas sp. A2-1-M11 TaxID=3113712 RepID=UPI002F959236